MTERMNHRILRASIAILALADGVLHLLLRFILFRGPPGPPPGAAPGGSGPSPGPRPSPFVLPLPDLFLLNFIGYVVLVLVFWFGRRWLGRMRWAVDGVLIVYAAATLAAWLVVGGPNPMGLGYTSKGIEIVLIIALIVHIWNILRQRGIVGRVA